MTAIQPAGGGSPVGSEGATLADVIDTILDKGMVIDAHVGVSVVGIQLLSIDARVVIASVDTYLRFAEAVNRLDLSETQGQGLPEVVSGVAKESGKKKMIDKAGEILGELVESSERREPQRERRER
jgi:hypothetical protein